MKLLGFLSAFGGITFVLLNTERIFKFVTRNHESMVRGSRCPRPTTASTQGWSEPISCTIKKSAPCQLAWACISLTTAAHLAWLFADVPKGAERRRQEESRRVGRPLRWRTPRPCWPCVHWRVTLAVLSCTRTYWDLCFLVFCAVCMSLSRHVSSETSQYEAVRYKCHMRTEKRRAFTLEENGSSLVLSL